MSQSFFGGIFALVQCLLIIGRGSEDIVFKNQLGTETQWHNLGNLDSLQPATGYLEVTVVEL